MTIALDASALLAVVFDEPGSELVAPVADQSLISAVNLSEAIQKMIDRGWTEEEVRQTLYHFRLSVVSFDEDAAHRAGFLRIATRHRGLSLGDRACLALAIVDGARVLTADRAWAGLKLGVEIEVIR